MDIQQQTQFNVLLIGDSCIDRYNIGAVDRLSPEAPVPVLKIISTRDIPGMAANVKLNLENLNCRVDFVTNSQTIIKTRYIDQRSGQHLLRVDEEEPLPSWVGQTPLPIQNYNAVVISDYNKGFLTYENIEQIIKQTRGPVFIDTKKQDLSRFSADNVYIKINEVEYKARWSVPKNLIVTLGDKGAMYKTINPGTETLYPTKPVDVVDVCGCGDTFLAALTRKYLETTNVDSAIQWANRAASITVQRSGNYAPTFKELL